MPTTLLVTAANWENKDVPCTFAVTANGVALAAVDPGKQIYELPAGTTTVEVTATPTKTTPYWENRLDFAVAASGFLTPAANRRAWVSITAVGVAGAGLTLATIRLSRFRDRTEKVNELLNGKIPTPRWGRTPDAAELKRVYGKWPPGTLDVQPRATVDYLDAANPVTVTAGRKRELNFAKDASLTVDVETVVLELAGVAAPRLFGVTWPKAVERKEGAAPTPFLVFVRQTGWQDGKHGIFVKGEPYPFNFDYAERCLFESMHYPPTPLSYDPKGWTLRPKGVPYQVAKSGAKAVTVFPVAHAIDGIGYGVLADMDQTGKLLAELQAFMFWQAGIALAPTSVGNTAIAGFSSANYRIVEWLTARRNLTSTFLNDTVRAIYFLDPPKRAVNGCVQAGRSWARRGGSDKRVRLYTAARDQTPAFRTLLELDRKAPALPAPPFFVDSADKKRTAAYLPTPSWVKAVEEDKIKFWDAHHFIPATVLTHALAQGDL